MVLFNYPIDKQQFMTLARQMYPESPTTFDDTFQDTPPYGYLHVVIDLKPTTVESLRLRTDVIKKSIRRQEEPDEICQVVKEQSHHFIDQAPCDDCGQVYTRSVGVPG